ncbi:MAG: hypothetical protein IV298_05295, partial [Cylindrospermopsis raciborskii KL1]|nr:hypothetical protein [Cylindrospermopsis raciborskii KL1]
MFKLETHQGLDPGVQANLNRLAEEFAPEQSLSRNRNIGRCNQQKDAMPDLGLCRRDRRGGLEIANPIYREILPKNLAAVAIALFKNSHIPSHTRKPLPHIAKSLIGKFIKNFVKNSL